MKLLMDTQTFLWWTIKDDKLTPLAYKVIENIENEIFFSAASGWEITIKYQLGKLILPTEPEVFIPENLKINQFSVLPINLYHIFTTRVLPDYNKYPFERLLAAQSMVENMPIISADSDIKKYNIEIIW